MDSPWTNSHSTLKSSKESTEEVEVQGKNPKYTLTPSEEIENNEKSISSPSSDAKENLVANTLSILPVDVLYLIFNEVDCVVTICNGKLVCSQWYRILRVNHHCKEIVEVARRAVHIGWVGTITREEAESRVFEGPKGTFLFRYSARAKSYVCTLKGEEEIEHIADIKPNIGHGGIVVYKKNGSTSYLHSLFRYVDFMASKGIVFKPVRLTREEMKLATIKGNPGVPKSILLDLGVNLEGSMDSFPALRKSATSHFVKELPIAKDGEEEESTKEPNYPEGEQKRSHKPKRSVSKKASMLFSNFFKKSPSSKSEEKSEESQSTKLKKKKKHFEKES